MTPIQFLPSNLSAQDIDRYSDAELDQYLKATEKLVEVEDPENLSEDLIERLSARAGALCVTRSRQIDVDELAARLENVATHQQVHPRSPSPATPMSQSSEVPSWDTNMSITEERDYLRDLDHETECYNTLIIDGGRPSHPVSLGRDVLENPGEYHDILSYWQRVNHDAEGRSVWQVFGSQVYDWQRFREWQRNNRADGCFQAYSDGVIRDLAEHRFTPSFQLDEDPERQDKVTTWIEYLDYHFWHYDQDMWIVEHHQPQHDRAWQRLVDSGVLKSFETEKLICSTDFAFQRILEGDRAEKDLNFAKLAVASAQRAITDTQGSSLSKRQRERERELQQHLAAVQSKLDAAMDAKELFETRSNLISEFFSEIAHYHVAKKHAEDRSILIQWVLLQFELIQLESNLANVNENDPNGQDETSKRNSADKLNGERVSEQERRGLLGAPQS